MKKLLDIIRDKAFDKFVGFLILFVCILFLGGAGIFYLVTKATIEPISMIITGLITTVTSLTGYYWGSSASSRDKDETINNMTNGNKDS